MSFQNYTPVTTFVLVGLPLQYDVLKIIFSCFLLFYIICLTANICIMAIIISDSSLHTPMYLFLWNVALLDICCASVVVPNLLVGIITQKKLISFYGCISQVHFFHFFGSTEVVLFSVMSFDRYVAIARPLRYTTIMSPNVCRWLISFAWVASFFHALIHSVMTSRLPFCGPNEVNHIFCDVKPLLVLACADTSINVQVVTKVAGAYTSSTFLLTVFSYIFISKYLFKIKTSQGRKRALSTCSAHLCVVFLQFGTAVFLYVRPTTTEGSLDQDRAIAIVFTVFTPALNPIIYTLRNKDIKKAVKKLRSKSMA